MQAKQSSATIITHPATTEYYQSHKNFIYAKPYSARELAELYGVSSKTFKKWIVPYQNELGENRGRFYTVRQVKFIFEKLDVPYMMEVA